MQPDTHWAAWIKFRIAQFAFPVGCGLMAAGIAQVMAQAGHDTIVRELSEELLEWGWTASVPSLRCPAL